MTIFILIQINFILVDLKFNWSINFPYSIAIEGNNTYNLY